MSIHQHNTSVPHPADDVESAAYIALCAHLGETMSTAEEKQRWLESSSRDDVEALIKRVANRAHRTERSGPPPRHIYDVPAAV